MEMIRAGASTVWTARGRRDLTFASNGVTSGDYEAAVREVYSEVEPCIGHLDQFCAEFNDPRIPAWRVATEMGLDDRMTLARSPKDPEGVRRAETVEVAKSYGLVPNVVAASDASVDRKRGGSGIGWLLAGDDGFVDTGWRQYERTHDVVQAEMLGIIRATKAALKEYSILRDGIGTLTILTDSKPALAVMERAREPFSLDRSVSNLESQARKILEVTEGVNIRFEWVRGHDGHPLNEIADRISRVARRGVQLEDRGENYGAIYESITDEARDVVRSYFEGEAA